MDSFDSGRDPPVAQPRDDTITRGQSLGIGHDMTFRILEQRVPAPQHRRGVEQADARPTRGEIHFALAQALACGARQAARELVDSIARTIDATAHA